MTAFESVPQPDPEPISYVTEIDCQSTSAEPLHHLFLPMREPEPLPPLEVHAEREPEAGL
jgi:hypothetical protein